MAIGPEQFEQKFLEEVAHAEVTLDRKLKEAIGRKYNEAIYLDVPSGLSVKAFNVLKEKYIEAGWEDVVWHSDQRDGDSLSFRFKKDNHGKTRY
jgi:hypothetical protein